MAKAGQKICGDDNRAPFLLQFNLHIFLAAW